MIRSWTAQDRSDTLKAQEVIAVSEIFIDYSVVGRATRFRTRVKAAVRQGLRDGDTVLVLGDDVPPAHARVVTVQSGNPEVELELLDA
jgi:hypothetical protein